MGLGELVGAFESGSQLAGIRWLLQVFENLCRKHHVIDNLNLEWRTARITLLQNLIKLLLKLSEVYLAIDCTYHLDSRLDHSSENLLLPFEPSREFTVAIEAAVPDKEKSANFQLAPQIESLSLGDHLRDFRHGPNILSPIEGSHTVRSLYSTWECLPQAIHPSRVLDSHYAHTSRVVVPSKNSQPFRRER
jgi:hypothetical protein